MSKANSPSPKIDPEIPAANEAEGLQKIGSSFAKAVEDAKAENAAGADPLNRNPNPEPPDPFDLSNLIVRQDFTETAGVRKLLTTVPCRKPNPQDFVRVHPNRDYRQLLALIELKDDREVYLVDALNARDLSSEICTRVLCTAINRQGIPFLWPVPIPDPNGRSMEWHRSMAEAAALAEKKWVRIRANMSLGAYDIYIAEGNLPEPEWPALPYKEILRIAFRHKFVDSPNHAVIQRLRGLT